MSINNPESRQLAAAAVTSCSPQATERVLIDDRLSRTILTFEAPLEGLAGRSVRRSQTGQRSRAGALGGCTQVKARVSGGQGWRDGRSTQVKLLGDGILVRLGPLSAGEGNSKGPAERPIDNLIPPG